MFWEWLLGGRGLGRLAVCRGLVFCGVVLVCLVVGVSGAFALETRLLVGAFGVDGTAGSTFEIPGAVGVDQSSGSVYVADLGSNSVEKFNSAHEPEAFTGSASNIVLGRLTGLGFRGSSELAVDSTSHKFYVASNGSQSVRAFQADGEPALFTEGPGAGTNEIGGFGELLGVAVDANGDIYASDYVSGVHVYAPSGKPLPVLSDFTNGYVAVDSKGAVYVNNFASVVEKFTPAEFPVTASTTYTSAGVVNGNPSSTVAVDLSSDHLLADERREVAEFDEAGSPVGTFGGQGAGALTDSEGVAVSSAAGQVYVSDREGARQVEIFGPFVVLPDVVTGEASEILPVAATLNGSVNPSGVEVTECHFDYGTTTGYGQSAACVQTVGAGTNEVAVTANLTNLAPGATYHFRLVASNANGTNLGSDVQFSTPPPPVITRATVSNLTGTAADLNAKVNPGGLATTCTFEFGTSTTYGHSSPCKPQPGAGTSDVQVTAHVTGLSGDTVYHWRVVASNAAGTTTGADHTFVYPTVGGGLPDGRAYEMITPPVKNAALVGDVFAGLLPDIAVDGSRLVLSSVQCFGDAASCPAKRNTVGASYAFSRGLGGWVGKALTPPASEFEVSTVASVNADTGAALVSAPTGPPRGQGEDDYYARQLDGTMTDLGPVSPPELGARGAKGNANFATADMSHLVVQVVGAGWPFEGKGASVLEYVGGRGPIPVGVTGGAGSTNLISVCSTEVGSGNETAASSSALSGKEEETGLEGRRVFFTAIRCPEQEGHAEVPVNEVYARVDEKETVKLSASECGGGGLAGEVSCRGAELADAEFQGASVDGSKALLTSTQQLTDDATNDASQFDKSRAKCVEMVGSGCNLYLYDFGRPVGARLTAVSAGGGAGGPRVQGVVAVSNDGSHVYFVARGVLSEEANREGVKARDGGENLYVFEGGVVRFIATLSELGELQQADFEEWFHGVEWANVSSDGRFLVFLSQAPLTGDDLRVDGGGAQVFRYDAVSGVLMRVSVGDGGFSDNGNAGVGNAKIVRSRALSGFVGGSGRRDPSMSDDGGRVFFMSPVGLTRGALNDVPIGEAVGREFAENVYEWELGGVGGCPVGRADGCVFLLSDGRDVSVEQSPTCVLSSSVCLVGSDLSGSNVFFTSASQLVPGDTDTQLDFYDARVCTSVDPCVTGVPPVLPGCGGEDCHGIPVGQPGAPSGGSALLSGLGNVRPASPGKSKPRVLSRRQRLVRALAVCRRKHRRVGRLRLACERQARRRYGTKAGKAGDAGRGLGVVGLGVGVGGGL